MDLSIIKLGDKNFVSTIDFNTLLDNIKRVYKMEIEDIEKEYFFKNINEEYSEYIISSIINNDMYLDNVILFTKEKFTDIKTTKNINNFVVADGLSKVIIMNRLQKTKEFVLKRISVDNIEIFKDLYRNLFIKQTNIPAHYLDIVLIHLKSKFNNDIIKFNQYFLNREIGISVITESNKECITEYITNKNIINKLLTYEGLNVRINLKLMPYTY